jgi:hypothetical protein
MVRRLYWIGGRLESPGEIGYREREVPEEKSLGERQGLSERERL